MITKICDRCKQRFNINSTCKHDEINTLTKSYIFNKWTRANELTMNLCPECSDSFNRWWNDTERRENTPDV